MFPAFYHAHHQLYQEDLPFWLSLVELYGDPVLELGCGTGRVLLPLTEAGVLTYGLDLDYEMLKFVHLLSPDSWRGCHRVFQANMTAFHLEMDFPLIIMPCNTFSILDDPSRAVCLRMVHRHLHPRGAFAVSLPNPEWLRHMPKMGESEIEAVFIHPESGNPVQVSSAWKRFKDIFELTWHYDHLQSDGRVERLSVITRQVIASLERYRDDFHDAGLSIRACYGDFDRSTYSSESPELILVAEPA